MGLDQTIRFPDAITPTWAAIRDNLTRVGESGQLRMIDGMPAFPDEVPEENWREVRIGTSAGMVTVSRGPGVLTCVVWGNADLTLNTAWNKVVWACAAASGGTIDTSSGPTSATVFAAAVGISPE